MATSPARKPATPEPVVPSTPPDFDDLLGDTSPVAGPDGATLVTNTEETPEAKRIRELQAELDQPMPDVDDDEFVPTAALTPEQQRLRDLEDQVARRRAEIAERQAASFEQVDAAGRDTLLIHVLVDGFPINGQVMYRGQEVEFVIDGAAYNQTKDRNGHTWLDLVNDPQGQYQRWGKVYFAPGPWPFEQWGSTRGLTDPTEIAAAEAAAAAERKRNRAAPVSR